MNRIELYHCAIEMKNQGKSYLEIANELNIPRRTVSDWVRGTVSVENLKKINGTHKTKDEDFIKAVKESFSISQALKAIGLEAKGGNYKIFKKRAKDLNCDLSHFTGQAYLKGKKHFWAKEMSIEESFCKEGSLGTCSLKNKIIKYNLKPYFCVKCGISEWMGEKLSLHLDHINGCNTDNRLENLRFLCPNCHSLTDTYCGKSKKKW